MPPAWVLAMSVVVFVLVAWARPTVAGGGGGANCGGGGTADEALGLTGAVSGTAIPATIGCPPPNLAPLGTLGAEAECWRGTKSGGGGGGASWGGGGMLLLLLLAVGLAEVVLIRTVRLLEFLLLMLFAAACCSGSCDGGCDCDGE